LLVTLLLVALVAFLFRIWRLIWRLADLLAFAACTLGC